MLGGVVYGQAQPLSQRLHMLQLVDFCLNSKIHFVVAQNLTGSRVAPSLPLMQFLFLLFQALGSFYFLHESLKNIYQFDFKGKTLPSPYCLCPQLGLSGSSSSRPPGLPGRASVSGFNQSLTMGLLEDWSPW